MPILYENKFGGIVRLCVTAALSITTVMYANAQLSTPARISSKGMTRVYGCDFYVSGRILLPQGVNYYPQKTPWKRFWPSYDKNIVSKDLRLIKRLGFNIVRIFIGDSDLTGEKRTMHRIGQLRNFLDLAQQRGLKVIVTLFDFMGDYSMQGNASTKRQLRLLMTSFCNHRAIFAWDIKNEPDLDFREDSAQVVQWLGRVLEQARRYDTCHLFTIGWAHPENASLLADKVDFVSFHSYRRPDSLSADLTRLLLRSGGKPVVLEEFGVPTYAGTKDSEAEREGQQAHYFSAIRKVLFQHGNIPWLVWTLYDFPEGMVPAPGRSAIQRAEQSRFGILRPDGSFKQGAAVLRR